MDIKWLLRVIGLPTIFGVIIALYYFCYDKKASGLKKARTNAKSMGFFAIFFCYPTICIVSFAATICTFVTEDDSVLDADDEILCQAPKHKVMIAVSWMVIAAVALGIPISFAWLLIRSARKYARETEANARDTARRLAKDLDVDVATASYVIRDVTIGSDYSFLMDACKLPLCAAGDLQMHT